MRTRQQYDRFIVPLVIVCTIFWLASVVTKDFGWYYSRELKITAALILLPLVVLDVVAALDTKTTTLRGPLIYLNKNPFIFWIRVLYSLALGVAALIFLVLQAL
ncbi:hypothetical protein HQ393_06965 [Chitinibacter bivalviorum]|uniref:Uncharacterized protein n=1 Tax=Chitinibacter bivalviorum TaxID=2739434 RepID=A0A7H9BJ51_9NEIS|nr:hypothetical protein [Chitinibacter bivalviorum]QLG88021.1 hypothetical protein HQ393_06965 [Chitinibacter bivalviorum]